MCEGQLARYLETLAGYDFTIEYRAGLRHNNADSLSRRPCVVGDCAHCERFKAKYDDNLPGLATRNIGVLPESANKGECLAKDGLSRKFEHSSEGLAPSNDICGMSKCSEIGQFLEPSSVKEPESTITGGSEMALL